ncbi:hypothetical protein HOY82DRAFT_541340 [Tuber indicum]|nr:hypothetical protein HOY82DRAFT_541340 [Tuber indicum]
MELITCSWRPVCRKRGPVTNTSRGQRRHRVVQGLGHVSNASSSPSSPASQENNTTAQESKQEKSLARLDTQQTLRPTTPAAQQSLSCKRSLTILSHEQISTRTTPELRKTQSTSGPLKFASPISQESASETGDNIVNDGDDATDNDLELGF